MTMPVADYVLTSFSPAMFGEGATAHIRIVTEAEARDLVDKSTRIVATRVSHDRLARNCFPQAAAEVSRYAMLQPGTTALHLHYRGPQVPETGQLPLGGMVTFYLVEVEEYQDAVA